MFVAVAAEWLSRSIRASASVFLYFVNSHYSTIIRQISILIQINNSGFPSHIAIEFLNYSMTIEEPRDITFKQK